MTLIVFYILCFVALGTFLFFNQATPKVTCKQEGCKHSLDLDPGGDCCCHSWNRTYEQLLGLACADER